MTDATPAPAAPTRPVPPPEDPAERLRRQWDQGEAPDVDAFLAQAGPLSPEQAAVVLRVDQRGRWRAGAPVPAEAYLGRYPAIAADPGRAVDLIFNEFLLREERGDPPTADEYPCRFPEYADLLREQIELHRALAAGASGVAVTLRVSPPDDAGPPGPAVPGYEVLGELGRGGMGVVYKARQTSLKRVVALKMLLAGPYAGPEQLARFRAEAEAVARLRHPNVVQIFEVGEHGGRPYLVLEYVEGGGLDGVLDGTPQNPRAAATLVQTLARAVHAAHQQGVVHRDLKPANVLLQKSADGGHQTEGGRPGGPASVSRLLSADFFPKIADFGLAKQMDAEQGRTPSEAILGTPSYMAPEQASGKTRSVGPAADVYALGAILYEMLTGRPPFRGETPLDTLQQVVIDDPVPPKVLQPKLPTDLATVCVKCLQKDPGRRYGSAGELAEDLRRFLAGEPIKARPVGPVARCYRWCRRRPAVAGLAAALVLGGLGALGVMTGLYLHARQETARAEQERDRAEGNFRLTLGVVEQYLTSVGQSPELKAVGLEQLRRKLLATAQEFFERFAQERGGDPAFRADLGRAYFRLGYISSQLGENDQAVEQYSRMQAIFADLVRDYPAEPTYLASLGESHHDMAALYDSLGREPEAEANVLEARRIRAQLVRDHPEVPTYRKQLARTLNNLAIFCEQAGRIPEAEANYQEALDLLVGLTREHEDVPEYQAALATTLFYRARLYRQQGLLDKARDSHEEARQVRVQLVGGHPGVPEYQAALAVSHGELAGLYRDLRRMPDAVAAYREAGKLFGQLAQEHPYVLDYQSQRADILLNLGEVYLLAGELADAEDVLQEARKQYGRLVDLQRRVVAYQLSLAKTCGNLGNIYYVKDRKPQAEKYFQEAYDLLAPLAREHLEAAEYQRDLAGVSMALGAVRMDAGRHRDAESAFLESRRMFEKLVRDHQEFPAYQGDLARASINLGILYRAMARPEDATASFREARRVAGEAAGRYPLIPDFQDLSATSLTELGRVVLAAGRKDEAVTAFQEACTIRQALAGRHPAMTSYQVEVGRNYQRIGLEFREQRQFGESLDWFARAIRKFEKLLQERKDDPVIQDALRDALWMRGAALNRLGRSAEALQDCDRALRLDTGQKRQELRAFHAFTLVFLRELAKAEAEAEELAQAKDLSGDALYELACAYSLAAAIVAQDKELLPPDRSAQAERYATRAVGMLVRARDASYFNGAATVEKMRKDNDLNALRLQPDFQKLLAEVEKKAGTP